MFFIAFTDWWWLLYGLIFLLVKVFVIESPKYFLKIHIVFRKILCWGYRVLLLFLLRNFFYGFASFNRSEDSVYLPGSCFFLLFLFCDNLVAQNLQILIGFSINFALLKLCSVALSDFKFVLNETFLDFL